MHTNDPVEIFYHVDEFCKLFDTIENQFLLKSKKSNKKNAGKRPQMTRSEVMTIKIMFHSSGFKTFKYFYYLSRNNLKDYFPKIVSYNRIVELTNAEAISLMLFSKIFCTGACCGCSFIDSTKLAVCHNKRASSHKTFKGIAKKGKTSIDWFFGMKLHFIINTRGEIIDFAITSGNIADNNRDLIFNITKNIYGKIFGDKGYLLNPQFYEELLKKNIQIITKKRKNMKKQSLLHIADKKLLDKRGLVESVLNIFKNILSLEHSRHRNVFGFIAHVASAIASYFFRSNKPSICPSNQPLIS